MTQHTDHNFTNYQEQLTNIILKLIPHCKIYLFGSRARKSNLAGSDIDLALDAGQKINLSTLAQINETIEESNIPFFVDVVDLQDATDEFKNKIKKDMVVWKE